MIQLRSWRHLEFFKLAEADFIQYLSNVNTKNLGKYNTKYRTGQSTIHYVGGYTSVPAHGGHLFCEQKNLKMEGCLKVASGKLWCMKYVSRSVCADMTG